MAAVRKNFSIEVSFFGSLIFILSNMLPLPITTVIIYNNRFSNNKHSHNIIRFNS